MILLLLSGLATGGSWLCYFKALSLGSVQSVAPVDKSSIVWTMLFGALIFQEDISSPTSIIGMILIVLGIVLMLPSAKGKSRTDGKKWLVYAIFSAVFASASALLGKAGIEGVDSYLGTAVRTLVVVVMAWLLVLVKRKGKLIRDVRLGSFGVIALSGVTTGVSWLCYYRALQTGPISIIAPIDRLSIVFTVLFSAVFRTDRVVSAIRRDPASRCHRPKYASKSSWLILRSAVSARTLPQSNSCNASTALIGCGLVCAESPCKPSSHAQ